MTALPGPFVVRERVSLTCPLGLRFSDAVTGATVTEGLRSVAWSPGDPRRRVEALVNPSGIHVFHGLPGLRQFENRAVSEPWQQPEQRHPFQVEVADARGRFLPCTFRVSAPQEGFATIDAAGSLPWMEAGTVPLFSAASRPQAAGLAVIRAELREAGREAPAAWAFAEATYVAPMGRFSATARGLADRDGRLTLYFPYPEVERGVPRLSLPAQPGLLHQQWKFTLSFYFAPSLGRESAADYGVRLNQPPADIRQGTTPEPSIDVTLSYGQELDPPLFLEIGAP